MPLSFSGSRLGFDLLKAEAFTNVMVKVSTFGFGSEKIMVGVWRDVGVFIVGTCV
jgi:hypothetical protein